MPSRNPKRRAVEKYLVPVTAKTLDIREAFRSPDDELILQQVIEASGVPHTTAYRILFTLVHRERSVCPRFNYFFSSWYSCSVLSDQSASGSRAPLTIWSTASMAASIE